jgi:hypothetical protein
MSAHCWCIRLDWHHMHCLLGVDSRLLLSQLHAILLAVWTLWYGQQKYGISSATVSMKKGICNQQLSS